MSRGWQELYSETFSHLISLHCIFVCLGCGSFLFDIDILELFPLILSLDDESLDDLTFCRHQFTELDSLIFEYLHELIDLEL